MRKTTPPLPPPVTMPLIDMDPIQRHGYSPEEAALSLGLGRTSTFALIKDGKLGVVQARISESAFRAMRSLIRRNGSSKYFRDK